MMDAGGLVVDTACRVTTVPRMWRYAWVFCENDETMSRSREGRSANLPENFESYSQKRNIQLCFMLVH
jgi:hypothetical protein